MALVVTPGAVDATSYADLASTLVRAVIDVRATAFLDLGDATVQEALLAMATSDIDAALCSTDRLAGRKADAAQALEVPRGGSTSIPPAIVRATQLLAFHLADKLQLGEIGTAIADTSNVKEDTLGPLTTVYFDRKAATIAAYDALPAHVRGLLASLLVATTVGYGYGTGTAVRGS